MLDYVQYVLYLFLLYLISTSILHYTFHYLQVIGHLQLPPSPLPLPIVGHLHYLTLPVHKSLQKLSSRHGPLLYLRFGLRPFLVVSSASAAAEIFNMNDLRFCSRPESPFGAGLLLSSHGFIMAPYGDYWRFMKKCSVSEILGSRQLDQSQDIRREELAFFLRKLLDKARDNEVVDVGGEVMRLVNNIVSRMAMSTRWGDEDDVVWKRLMDQTVKLAGNLALTLSLGPLEKLGVLIFQWQMMDVNRKYDQLLEKILRVHEEKTQGVGEKERKDLTDLLLEIYNDEDAEVNLSRNQIKSFLLDIFLAGTNTLTGSIKWVMANLLNHPKVFKKLREEIESNMVSRLVEEKDVQNLHYLHAIVKESMRLHPPFPLIPRASVEDCKILGYDIPKNTNVAINAYAIMRDPEIWDRPNEFFPERFLALNKEQHFRFVAFGGGRRICPGSKMALNVMYCSIAAMVQCFDWKVRGFEDNTSKVCMDAKSGVTLEMSRPILCVPAVHFNPFS